MGKRQLQILAKLDDYNLFQAQNKNIINYRFLTTETNLKAFCHIGPLASLDLNNIKNGPIKYLKT